MCEDASDSDDAGGDWCRYGGGDEGGVGVKCRLGE